MGVIILGNDRVRYEVFGRGRPVIFLHTWFNSLRYWMPTLGNLQGTYRVYAVDLFGYGDSARNPDRYPLEQQIALIDDFMQQLGMQKAAFVGHGLGALIAAEFARRYPDRVPRLMSVSGPLFDSGDLDRRVPVARRILPLRAPNRAAPVESSPNAPTVMSASAAMRAALAEAAAARARASGAAMPSYLAAANAQPEPDVTFNPLIDVFAPPFETLISRNFKRGDANHDRMMTELNNMDPRAVSSAISHFDAGTMLDTLRLLSIPVLLLYGLDDPIMPPPTESILNYLTMDKEGLLVPIGLPGVRHYPMLEDERFGRLLLDFLERADLSTIEVKERWRRRSR
jgi:pimeloyl-ACP methyl ester carboxylesterase